MFREIFDNELDDCVSKMSIVFKDHITRNKDQRGFYYDGLFVLLNYSLAENIYYFELARIEKQFNNILSRGLIDLFDKVIKEYSIIGIGMYIDSPIRPLIKLMDKKYNRRYSLSTNGIIVLEYEIKRRKTWDSGIQGLRNVEQQENVKEKL